MSRKIFWKPLNLTQNQQIYIENTIYRKENKKVVKVKKCQLVDIESSDFDQVNDQPACLRCAYRCVAATQKLFILDVHPCHKRCIPPTTDKSDLTSTVEFFSNKYDELKSRLDSRDKEVVELLTQNRVLEETVKDLGFRLSSLEQHSRECNVEINGLPEFKSENLVQTVLQIGKTVSHTINDTDVMSCFRVAKKDNNNKRPREGSAKTGGK
ncbi:unnamed protein product, partial [Brenthis ino]